MIHARERPHTGGVIQLKRVELAKTTSGATSASPLALARSWHTGGTTGSCRTWLTPGACRVTLLLCPLSHHIPRFLHVPMPGMALGYCLCCLGSRAP